MNFSILSFVYFHVNMHINEIVLEISGYPSKKRLTLWAGTSDLFPFPFPFPFSIPSPSPILFPFPSSFSSPPYPFSIILFFFTSANSLQLSWKAARCLQCTHCNQLIRVQLIHVRRAGIIRKRSSRFMAFFGLEKIMQ